MKVYRPADGKETAAAWISALSGNAPTCLVLTRQNLPQYEKSGLDALKGGYILADSDKKTPDVLLIASGSEVEQCMQAKVLLKEKGVDARVVSMPCIEEFEKQSRSYQDAVLPPYVRARVCVEAGSPYSWYKYAGDPRRDHRNEYIRSLGACGQTVRNVRLYRRKRCGKGFPHHQ